MAERPQHHLTDEADPGVRGDGAHDAIVDPDANLSPGEVDAADPDTLGDRTDRDGRQDEREQVLDHIRDDR